MRLPLPCRTARCAATAVPAALGLALTLAAAAPPSQHLDLAGEVDPLIGSANGGNTFPGAVVPFGMV
ncbi:MAG TPA: hypothetical protein VJA16_21875, partial [Thermoanaerobaculia bacterium]